MAASAENALIVQSDATVLLDVHSPRAEEARATLSPFAELIKSPEHVHTYRLTPLSIWNVRAMGITAEKMVAALREHARYGVPPGIEQEITDLAARYGRVVLFRDGETLRCTCHDEAIAERLARDCDSRLYGGSGADERRAPDGVCPCRPAGAVPHRGRESGEDAPPP